MMSGAPDAAAMKSKLPSMTLIVAVTPSNGIGRAGTLPWPRISSEMAYFSRVTKRVAAASGSGSGSGKNAVVMGRKTWESIPSKFRPLPGRVNVVISRRPDDLDLGGHAETYAASSLVESIETLQAKHAADLGRVFVIGGAQIYAEALKREEADRVLLTRIKKDYECDTFFPVDLGGEGEAAGAWKRASDGDRDAFIGEKGCGGEEWNVELWTRK